MPLEGHTRPVIGGLYGWEGSLRFPPWELTKYNPITGLCYLVQPSPWGGRLWLSVGCLRRLHLVRLPEVR